MAAKEQHLLELQDEFGKLKQDHDRARARLQEEIAAVKELEAQLAALSKCFHFWQIILLILLQKRAEFFYKHVRDITLPTLHEEP